MRTWTSIHRFGLALVAAGLFGCDGGDTPIAPARSSAQAAAADVSFSVPAELAPGDGASGEDDAFALEVDSGRYLFLSTCSACHGAAGQGMPNQGPDLRNSQVVARSTDEQLLAFVAKGRAPTDPGNNTGLAMPPRGGNGALTDRHIRLITRYVRTLQMQPAGPVETTGVQHE